MYFALVENGLDQISYIILIDCLGKIASVMTFPYSNTSRCDEIVRTSKLAVEADDVKKLLLHEIVSSLQTRCKTKKRFSVPITLYM